jgi:hypothetical protein
LCLRNPCVFGIRATNKTKNQTAVGGVIEARNSMRLFGFGRKPIAAEMLGRNLTALMIDAEDCWRDVCMLRAYKTTGPVATCEMAFARAALVKNLYIDQAKQGVSDRLQRAADELILESFAGEDTPDTIAFFGRELIEAAPQRVAFYMHHTFMMSQLSGVLAARLGVPGPAAAEGAWMFEKVEKRARDLMDKVTIV